MPVTADILATYRGPARVLADKLARGVQDPVALVYLAAGAILGFVAQLPRLRREALLPNPEFERAILAERGEVRQIEAVGVPQDLVAAKFEALVSGALFAWVFVMPLLFYLIAALSAFVMRRLGGRPSGLAARLALFWSFLAASPLLLLQGLGAGLIGPGPAVTGLSVLWLAVFLWFWIASMREAGWGGVPG
ncbi:MAG: YIP1 family protein [Rhodobacteraceae bacterium]|nr:MAG: YIP1 family protein [Paracoccaceae bacterium]